MHATLQAVSEDSGVLKVRGHAATVTFQFCHAPPGLLQLGLQRRHLNTDTQTHRVITFTHLISHPCSRARQRVLPHLGIELLPRLSLRLQFFLRLLQSSADEFHLGLAALQLHGQLTFCTGSEGCDFVMGNGEGHFKNLVDIPLSCLKSKL